MLLAVVLKRDTAFALSEDDGFDARGVDLRANGIGVVILVSTQCLDAIGDCWEQRAKALDILRLAG